MTDNDAAIDAKLRAAQERLSQEVASGNYAPPSPVENKTPAEKSALESLALAAKGAGNGTNSFLAELVGIPASVLRIIINSMEPGAVRMLRDNPKDPLIAESDFGVDAVKRLADAVPGGVLNTKVGPSTEEQVGAIVGPGIVTGAAGGIGAASLGIARGLIGAPAHLAKQYPVLARAANAPLSTAVGEGAIGAGAGAGQAVVHQNVDDTNPMKPTLELGGSFVGGLVPSGLRVAGERLARSFGSGAEAMFNFGRRLIVGSENANINETWDALPKKVKDIAALKVQGMARGPRPDVLGDDTSIWDTVKKLDSYYLNGGSGVPGVKLTGVQASEDRGLGALQRMIARSRAEATGRDVEMRLEQNAAIREAMRDAAGGGRDLSDAVALREHYSAKLEKHDARMKEATDLAIERARTKTDAARPGMSETDAASLGKLHIDTARQAARVEEKALWDKVRELGGDTIKDTRSIVRVINEENAKFPLEKNGVVPKEIANYFKPRGDNPAQIGETADVGLLAHLRDQILHAKRMEGGKIPANSRTLTALTKVQEEVLKVMEATARDADAGKPYAAAYQEAAAFTRALHDNFTRGPIGAFLESNTKGGAKIDPRLLFDRLVNVGGNQGAINVENLLSVAGGPEGINGAIEAHIRSRMFEQTVVDGQVKPELLKRFMSNDRFGRVLEKFPGLRDELADVKKAQEVADELVKAGAKMKGNRGAELDAAELFLGKDPEKAMTTVTGASKPSEALKALTSLADQDPTGRARSGLRQSWHENLMARASSGLNADGEATLTANGLKRELDRYGRAMVESGLYSREEVNRIETIQRVLVKIESAEKGKTAGSITSEIRGNVAALESDVTLENIMAHTMSPFTPMGRVGRIIGKVISDAVGDLTETKVMRLLEQAVFDPDTMRALLTRVTEKNAADVAQRIRAGMAASAFRHDDEAPPPLAPSPADPTKGQGPGSMGGPVLPLPVKGVDTLLPPNKIPGKAPVPNDVPIGGLDMNNRPPPDLMGGQLDLDLNQRPAQKVRSDFTPRAPLGASLGLSA